MASLGHAFRRRPVAALGLVILLALGTVVGLGSLAAAPTAVTASASFADEQVQLAAASLAHAQGPAASAALACSATGAGAEDCALAPDATPAVPGSGFVWNNLTSIVGAGPSQFVAAMTFDTADNYVLLFGGETSTGHPANSTWSYWMGTWTNLTGSVTGAPPAVEGDSLAYAGTSGGVILFGGITSSGGYSGFTYLYHNDAWTNVTATVGTAPSPRAWAAFSIDSHDGELILFGGRVAGPPPTWVADTWTFKASKWTNITATQTITLPPLVSGAILTDYPLHGAFLFGGAIWGASATPHPATYVFSAGQWQNLSGTLAVEPPAFYYGGGAFVPTVSGIFVFGGWYLGSGGAPIAWPQTWEFAGGAWTNVTAWVVLPTGEPSDLQGGTAFVGADDTILTYGTAETSPYGAAYTWALAGPTVVAVNVSATTVAVGTTLRFLGSTESGLLPFTVLWSFGDGTTSPLSVTSHAYTKPGAYQANFTATSLVGVSATASVTILALPALTISVVTVPSTPTAGNAIGFVPITWGGQGPYGYVWSFGDGATSIETVPTHAYANPGLYEVRVNVSDTLGFTAHATLNLTVTSASTSPPPPALSPTSGIGLEFTAAIVILAAIAIMFGVLLLRRPKTPPSGPTPTPPGTTPPNLG